MARGTLPLNRSITPAGTPKPGLEAKRPTQTSSPRVEVAEVDIGEDLWDVERAASLPDLVDESTSDTFSGFDESPTAKPRVVDIDKAAARAAGRTTTEDVLARARSYEGQELDGEATLPRPSPLEVLEAGEQSIEEPTLLRPSPLEQMEEGEQSIEEPTLLRPSPLEQSEQEARAARAAAEAEALKPSQESTGRKIRIDLPPEVIAQAEAELASDEAIKPPVQPQIRELPRDSEEDAGPRALRPITPMRPRSAPLWGLFLAVVTLVAATVVVALDKGWLAFLIGPPGTTGTTTSAGPEPSGAIPSEPGTASVAPTAPGIDTTPTPTTDAAPSEAPGAEAGAPPTDVDAGVTATTDAGAVDAGASAAVTDAGAPADAGAPGTERPTQTGAPPGDPASLPATKGYLVVTSTASIHVYVQGTKVGLTNESLEVDCGPKFVRLGDPPANPAPGGSPLGVKWRSEGKSTVVACRAVTTMTITPSP
jgi:hypothetical protein